MKDPEVPTWWKVSFVIGMVVWLAVLVGGALLGYELIQWLRANR